MEDGMFLIVGLGNPEPEYSNTRHNMGFDVINKLSETTGIKVEKNKFNGIYGMGDYDGEKIILLKPQTYMNDSGKSIIQVKQFYKIENDKIIVIYDDVDLLAGTIRVRQKGHANTHNGMKSVVSCLGTIDFPRVRVGIGTPDKSITDYVLERISNNKRKVLEEGIEKAVMAVEEIIRNGVDSAMNKYNSQVIR